MHDFAEHLVAEKTEGFAGRDWVFAAVDDWIASSGERFFVIEGEPGSGKTALAARLTQFSRDEQLAPVDCLAIAPGFLSAVHFCSRQDSTLLDPQTFVESISLQLAGRYPAYRQALAEISGESAIRIEQHIQNVAAGGNAVGLMVRGDLTLNLGGLSAEQSFARTIVNPLADLYRDGFQEPLLMLVDSLDEAALYTGKDSILTLLSRARGLPSQVRFIVTTRPRLEITRPLNRRGATTFSLSASNSSEDIANDIAAYAKAYLQQEPQLTEHVSLEDFLTHIKLAADGNFLVLRFLLPTLKRRGVTSLGDFARLPSQLDDIYFGYIEEYGLAGSWQRYSLILGTLIVSQIPLTTRQIEVFSGADNVNPEVRDVADFLEYDQELPAEERRYAVYHRSFAEFLLDPNRSEEYHCRAETFHQRIVDYFLDEYAPTWAQEDTYGVRDYGLRFTATHLNAFIETSLSSKERSRRSAQLVDLVRGSAFQQAHQQAFDNLLWLQRDLQLALETAVRTDQVNDIPTVFRAALGLQQLRRRELDPQGVFTLAQNGDLQSALRRLTLFAAEPRWLDSARLLCAWLAKEGEPQGARKIVMQLQDVVHPWPFDLLRDLVGGAFDETPVERFPLPGPPHEEEVLMILDQAGAGGMSVMEGVSTEHVARTSDASSAMLSEGLYQDLVHEAQAWAVADLNRTFVDGPDEKPVYTAARDAAPLVSFALANPQEGNRYFGQYRDLKAANQYRQYRDLSLWMILEAVLRHPDDAWVREQSTELARAALTDTGTSFQEALFLVLIALSEPTAEDKMAGLQTAVESINELDHTAREILDDVWGYRRRFYAALAEASTAVPDAGEETRLWLEKATRSKGYAGFQYAARLAHAEAALICGQEDAIAPLLDMAEESAQNINDAVFCVRSTARVQALKETWWSETIDDIGLRVELLTADPDGPLFASRFHPGEAYALRSNSPDQVALPPLATHAQTLEEIAELFRQPVTELQRLNPDFPSGDAVLIPDAGLAAMIATRLAAELLANPGELTFNERLQLMLRLTPIVVGDRTALDTILARVALLARPKLVGQQIEKLMHIGQALFGEGTSGAQGRNMSGSQGVMGVKNSEF